MDRPTPESIQGAAELFFEGDRDRVYADSVRLAFETWPRNEQPEQVLAKVVLLNRLYSTNIFDVWSLTEHILRQSIDLRLERGDLDLIEAIAKQPARQSAPEREGRRVYSFATKYCAFHRPATYQIYDSQVDAALWAINKEHPFSKYKRDDIHASYAEFIRVIGDFRREFGCEAVGRRELDRYLWTVGDSVAPGRGERAAGRA